MRNPFGARSDTPSGPARVPDPSGTRPSTLRPLPTHGWGAIDEPVAGGRVGGRVAGRQVMVRGWVHPASVVERVVVRSTGGGEVMAALLAEERPDVVGVSDDLMAGWAGWRAWVPRPTVTAVAAEVAEGLLPGLDLQVWAEVGHHVLPIASRRVPDGPADGPGVTRPRGAAPDDVVAVVPGPLRAEAHLRLAAAFSEATAGVDAAGGPSAWLVMVGDDGSRRAGRVVDGLARLPGAERIVVVAVASASPGPDPPEAGWCRGADLVLDPATGEDVLVLIDRLRRALTSCGRRRG